MITHSPDTDALLREAEESLHVLLEDADLVWSETPDESPAAADLAEIQRRGRFVLGLIRELRRTGAHLAPKRARRAA
ncbi:MAG: hypothetical protein ACOZNI_30085 [Myxococcota bacterium]